MSKTIEIQVPKDLIFENTIEFVKDFSKNNEEAIYIFDFENSRRIDPFSLLYLSSELLEFKIKNKTSSFFARNYQHLSYHAHMGFFKSFGLPFGKEPGEAEGSSTYYPIETFNIFDIKQSQYDLGLEHPGEVLDQYALNMSNILTQGKSEVVNDVLRYSIREILRNIVEHSSAENFSLCAQYLPSLKKVNFAVLDKGVGLKATLSNNPKLKLNTDLDALKWSLKPGVSGKVYPGQKRKPKDNGLWTNSGFGLYMTSRICKLGGSFFISSGNSGLLITEKQERTLNLETHGTAVYLTINLEKIYDLQEMLSEFREDTPKNVFLTPSKSSMDNLK